MPYKVKLIPYGKYGSTSAMNTVATEFGFPATFITSISFSTKYGYLLFQGDTELDGVKFYVANQLANDNSPLANSWFMVLDSTGNVLKNANGIEYGVPSYAAGFTSFAADSTYFIGPAVSPACGKIDGVYQLPFVTTAGKYFEFNGKKYVTVGGNNSCYWLVAANPTE